MKLAADALLRSAVGARDVPGAVAAVTTRDATVYASAFGERELGGGAAMTTDTAMWIASMTKPLTGVAAMRLVEQGR
ncbi:MAG: serine hydrolase, partial [Proteobacteria bacterium]|nr:serine hydrolase [Pseudomonadota bacterium]